MRICPLFHVKKRYLLIIAGLVWLIAGINVARLGIEAYNNMSGISVVLVLLSIAVFVIFGMMFYRMSTKHHLRIKGFKENTRPFWHFFDLKSYIIMIFMMTGGILLRSTNIVSNTFVAFFYTGLGSALASAGIMFIYFFISYKD